MSDKLVQLGRKPSLKRDEEMTQRFATWGDKLLQHADVLHEMQENGNIKPITVQLSPTEMCFTGDTKVKLLDGTHVSLLELSQRTNPFWVYSYDVERKRIVPGLAHSARLIKENAEIVEVELDDGSIIRCTDDHKFLTRDGEYVEVKRLSTGASLMPLYSRLSTDKDDSNTVGYEMFLENDSMDWKFTHRMVSEEIELDSATVDNAGALVLQDGKQPGCHTRHHINYNRLDNTPENLVWMSMHDHRIHHSTAQHERLRYLATIGQHPFQTPEHREWSRKWMKQMWPKIKAGEITMPPWTEERREKISKLSRERNIAQMEAGTHPFHLLAGDGHHTKTEKWKKENGERQRRLASEGKHGSQTPKFRQSKRDLQNQRLNDGNHYFLSDEHRQRSAARLRNVRAWMKFLFESKLTKVEYPFSRWKEEHPENHKIVRITPCGSEDVYCLTVEKYHNFALSAGVFVSNCQSGCSFCSVSGRPIQSSMKWDDLVNTLVQFKNLGAKSLELTGGGNPLLYKCPETDRRVSDIVRLASKLGYKIGVITNSERLTALEKDVHGMISWVRVSLIRLDEGKDPKDYDFNGFPYERLAFSYIINDGGPGTGLVKRTYEPTSERTIERIAELVDLHEGKIKFVRFAGDCLTTGANKLTRQKMSDVIASNDRWSKFFLKAIEDNDVPFDDACYVGMIRPYVAPAPDGSGYRVYTCTSHVLNTRTYDEAYALCGVQGTEITDAWEGMSDSYRSVGHPYQVNGNCGKNWRNTCSHCFYSASNRVLHAVATKTEDGMFPLWVRANLVITRIQPTQTSRLQLSVVMLVLVEQRSPCTQRQKVSKRSG